MKSVINQVIDTDKLEQLKRIKENERQKRTVSSWKDDDEINFSLEQREFIQEKMFELETPEFFALYLKYWQGFDDSEIAKLISVEEKRVKRLVEIGLRELRKLYGKEFFKWKKNLGVRMAVIEERLQENRAQKKSKASANTLGVQS